MQKYAWHTLLSPYRVILGALPFPSDVQRLVEQHGVSAVVTLNENFEIMVSPEMYADAGVAHLHLPTTDFLFAPEPAEVVRGVDFIQEHESRGGTVYVHCKAGRGRSTTLVCCFLVARGMTPQEALDFVRDKRPQVKLAKAQWDAVVAFYERQRQQGGGEDTDGAAPASPSAADGDKPAAFSAAKTPGSVNITRDGELRIEDGYIGDERQQGGGEDTDGAAPASPSAADGDKPAAFSAAKTPGSVNITRDGELRIEDGYIGDGGTRAGDDVAAPAEEEEPPARGGRDSARSPVDDAA